MVPLQLLERGPVAQHHPLGASTGYMEEQRGDWPALVEAARDRSPEGMLLNAPRGNLLRFMPALNVGADEIDTALAWLDGLFAQARARKN